MEIEKLLEELYDLFDNYDVKFTIEQPIASMCKYALKDHSDLFSTRKILFDEFGFNTEEEAIAFIHGITAAFEFEEKIKQEG